MLERLAINGFLVIITTFIGSLANKTTKGPLIILWQKVLMQKNLQGKKQRAPHKEVDNPPDESKEEYSSPDEAEP
jgi:hypothetical protein